MGIKSYPRMRYSHGRYYYDHGRGPEGKRRWQSLSRDYGEACIKWRQIEADGTGPPVAGTFAALSEHYIAHVLTKKARATQDLHKYCIKFLNRSFGHMRLPDIEPHHIYGYLDANPSKIAANRQVGVMSVIFKVAIRKGWLRSNPCRDVERNPEKPCDHMPTDKDFLAVKSVATAKWQAIMDLDYLTGMRQQDLRLMRLDQLEEEGIRLKQSKTGRKQFMPWTPALRDAVDRLKAARPTSKRLRNVQSVYLIVNRSGEPYTRMGFGCVFRKFKAKAMKEGLLSESFTFHQIRAKAATDAEEQGLDPQRLCGHTTRRQTEVYLRSKRVLMVDTLASIVEKKADG